MRDHAVDGADFDAGADALCAFGEDGAGSVCVRQDEEPRAFADQGGFTRIVCAASGLPASGRGFHHDERGIRTQCGVNAGVTHVGQIRNFIEIDRLADGVAER